MRIFFIDIKIEGDGFKIDVRKGTIGNLIMSRSWESNPVVPTFIMKTPPQT